jgi:ubiquinone/menaquinone biosynthesis C-methylase UbiE
MTLSELNSCTDELFLKERAAGAKKGNMKKKHYEKTAGSYDKKWKNYTRRTINRLLALLPVSLEGKKVLDFGCGTGALIKEILTRHPGLEKIIGYDPVEEMLREAQKKIQQLPGYQQEKVHLQSNQNYETQFDLIVSSSVLHYLPGPEETLLHLKSLLKKGGALVLLDYTKDSLLVKYFRWAVKLKDPLHHRAYYPQQIRKLVENAGFIQEADAEFRISFLWKGYVIRASKKVE